MRKTALSIVTTLCSAIMAYAQGNVELYAIVGYSPIEDMSKLDIALFDARREQTDDIATYARRYNEDINKEHPSVLSNKRVPTHILIAASNPHEVEEVETLVEEYNKSTAAILLYSGKVTEIDSLRLKAFDAIYSLKDNIDNPFDILTQAAFGGTEIRYDNMTWSVDNSRLITTPSPKTRLGYGQPSDVGMNGETLKAIDEIAKKAISEKATPSCNILIARHGVVVYNKCFGQTTYKDGKKVTCDMLYDLASVSKAFGTLPIVMKAFDEQKLNATTTLGTLIDTGDSAKNAITTSELLLHQSGLQSGIAFYPLCVDSTTFESPLYVRKKRPGYTIKIDTYLYMSSTAQLNPQAYTRDKDAQHMVQISSSLYATDSVKASIIKHIDNTRMFKKTYRYSDLNFIYLQRMLEQIYQKPLNRLFDETIAKPMGISRLLYKPLMTFDKDEIIPTENDQYFRKELVWGTVHDQTASLMGGVSGNAGLFGTANELAKIALMYMSDGQYGGTQILSTTTTIDFKKRHSDNNRRAYGFDKPNFDGGGPVTDMAPQESYGHSGFSGTLVWMDPKNDIIYIFLSNRIHPDSYNTKLTTHNIRSNIHDIIYNSIEQ